MRPALAAVVLQRFQPRVDVDLIGIGVEATGIASLDVPAERDEAGVTVVGHYRVKEEDVAGRSYENAAAKLLGALVLGDRAEIDGQRAAGDIKTRTPSQAFVGRRARSLVVRDGHIPQGGFAAAQVHAAAMNKALVVVDAAIAQFKHTRLMTHIQAGAVVGDIVPKDHLCGHQ